MFPAPYDALPIPPHPSIDQYKKLAKELVRICKSGDSAGYAEWSKAWVENLAQLSELVIPPGMPVRIDQWSAQVSDFARRTLNHSPDKACRLADAQFVLARVHGFASWPKFARHIDELAHAGSAAAQFEAAADAIVAGDQDALRRLLNENPDLVRARSPRGHRATLLHYVAANGVEGWRQKTPQNIVEIAAELLDAGAEVDAVAQMYGSDCTTLGLAATSVHPERAGVQIALLQLLLDRGARIDHTGSAGNPQPLVKACFANGRGHAAQFLAAHCASLDLEEAAAVGRLDTVRSFFNYDGSFLKPTASEAQLREGFLWACQFGRNRVVEFLLERGIDLGAQGRDGQTALHNAVIGAQFETVKLLLESRAPLEVKNIYGGTVLGQAIWSAFNSPSPASYLPIIEALLEAGAKVEPEMEEALARLLRRQPGKAPNS
jgi:ankyrin repeat protein